MNFALGLEIRLVRIVHSYGSGRNVGTGTAQAVEQGKDGSSSDAYGCILFHLHFFYSELVWGPRTKKELFVNIFNILYYMH